MQKALIALALAAVFGMAHPQTAPVLKGTWASEEVENYGSHFATRLFVFTGDQWQVVYRAYADAQGKQPLFHLNVGGVYALGSASAKVPAAFEGVFPATSRHITADSENGVKMFAGMGCVLQQGHETPLLNEGCGFVPGLMQAMGEYDLVSFKSNRLYFGDRAGDLTKARPAALTGFGLIKR